MAIFTSQWIRNLFLPRVAKNKKCKDIKECNQLLQLILDGEASKDEEEYFFQHIKNCNDCYNGYKLEQSIKKLIRTKLKKQSVPQDLVDSIKVKIQNSLQ